MADDFAVTAGVGTTIRAIEKSSKKTQVVVLDLGGAGAESLLTTALPTTNPVIGGATSDAAVITDATGSIHQYLRGLVKLIAAKINVATVDTVSAVTAITNALPAGTNAIGTVRGSGLSVTATLAVTNGAYSIADVVGGLITFANAVSANGKHAVINSIVLSGVAAIPYELWLFNADIATPAADNAAFTLVVADTLKCLGVIRITAGDYCAAQSAFNVATLAGVGKQVKAAAANTSIYAYLKATAVTSPGTTTLYLTVDFEYLD
jgi:hypothetical protein